nr:hypothetical protein [uncultured Pedobacter sp.]
MKKLANVSPFLLLLVPVFIMMILTFATSISNSHNEDVALKSSSATKTEMVKVSNPFSK